MAWKRYSHSSVERTIGPDSIVLTDFALSRISSVVKFSDWQKMMLKNLEKTNGLYNSQRLMLKLIEKGEFSRGSL